MYFVSYFFCLCDCNCFFNLGCFRNLLLSNLLCVLCDSFLCFGFVFKFWCLFVFLSFGCWFWLFRNRGWLFFNRSRCGFLLDYKRCGFLLMFGMF
ncbi:hypothetical protein E2C01_082711 [Portunus trituberculatus]|uniref:Uncharacterized protein n=1 Tax=Portunus trituberculatus TaxID=210409 RepID=A0A5B7IV99_PORTR|nr:hypothetical protein [Portunus trituberculatus]